MNQEKALLPFPNVFLMRRPPPPLPIDDGYYTKEKPKARGPTLFALLSCLEKSKVGC